MVADIGTRLAGRRKINGAQIQNALATLLVSNPAAPLTFL
jgi:hypothetical protein